MIDPTLDWSEFKFFSEDEFRCKCGCGQAHMMRHFVERLEKAREIARIPFVITSGYRCEAHEKRIGGKGNHCKGRAVDIATPDAHTRFRVLVGLIGAGLVRIGIDRRFIHGDDMAGSSRPQNVVWLYDGD